MGMEEIQKMKKAEQEVEEKSAELIKEFYNHMKEYIRLNPEDKDRKDEIFQGCISQKIAGLQLSIIHISDRINKSIEKHEKEKENT